MNELEDETFFHSFLNLLQRGPLSFHSATYTHILAKDLFLLQALELPEGKVKFTPKLRFISETADERECCYRVLDENGNRISSSNYVEVLYSPSALLPIRSFCVLLDKHK